MCIYVDVQCMMHSIYIHSVLISIYTRPKHIHNMFWSLQRQTCPQRQFFAEDSLFYECSVEYPEILFSAIKGLVLCHQV